MNFTYPITIYICPDCQKAFPVLRDDAEADQKASREDPERIRCPKCGDNASERPAPAMEKDTGLFIKGELKVNASLKEAC